MRRRFGEFINAIDDFSEPLDRLHAALDASCVVGTWDWDIVQESMVYDAGAARLLAGDASLAEQKLYGVSTIAAVHPADHEWLMEHVQRAIRTAGLMLAEYRVIGEDGGVRWLLSRGRTYHDDQGHPVRSRGIIIDITEMRGTGERYLISNAMTPEDLLDRVADVAIALKRMMADDLPDEVRASVDLLLMSIGRALARANDGH